VRTSDRTHDRYGRPRRGLHIGRLLGRFDREGLDLLTPGTPRRLLGAAQELLHLCV